MPKGREVDILGDSMVVASSHALRYYLPKVRMDAKSNRRWTAADDLVATRGEGLRRAVVLAFGTNAGTDATAVRRSLDAIGPDRMVVLVTLHGPFSRIDVDNSGLRDLARGGTTSSSPTGTPRSRAPVASSSPTASTRASPARTCSPRRSGPGSPSCPSAAPGSRSPSRPSRFPDLGDARAASSSPAPLSEAGPGVVDVPLDDGAG